MEAPPQSAILAALQICLGANARFTHRARKLEDLIRHGWAGDAEVEVKLRNTPDGYRFKKFGASITILRTIKRGAPATIKLIADNGAFVSGERKHLTRMLDAFSISVENPCVVLDQENSKKFLMGSNSDKYFFFLKATSTRLSPALRTSEVIAEIRAQLKTYQMNMLAAQQLLPRLEGRVRDTSEVLDKFEALNGMHQKVITLRHQLLWAGLEDRERTACSAEEHAAAVARSLQTRRARLDGVNAKIAQLQAARSVQDEEVNRCSTAADAAIAERTAAKAALRAAEAPLKLAVSAEKDALEQQGELRRQKADIMRQIKEERRVQLSAATNDEERRLLQRTAELDQTLERLDRELEQLGTDGVAADAELQAQREIGHVAAARLKAVQIEKERAEGWLREMDGQRGDPLAAFGRGILNVVRAMTTTHAARFREAPVGPIGAYIKMKPVSTALARVRCAAAVVQSWFGAAHEREHQHYAAIVQEHLDKLLTGFIVTSQADKNALMDIIRKAQDLRSAPSVYIIGCTGQRHRTPVFEGVLQMSEMIKVERTDVFNVLVDHSGIERSLVAPDKGSAERLLQGTRGHQQLVHGAKDVFYPQAAGPNGAGRGRWERLNTRNGNASVKMNISLNARPLLAVDMEQQRRNVQQQLEGTAAEYTEAKPWKAARHDGLLAQFNVLKQRSDAAARRQAQLSRERFAAVRQRDKAQRRLEEVQSARRPANDVADLEAESDAIAECIDELARKAEAAAAERMQAQAAVRPLKAAFEAAERALGAESAALEAMGPDIEAAEEKADRAAKVAAKLVRHIGETEAALAAAQEAAAAARAVAAQTLEAVSAATRARQPDWDGEPMRVGKSQQQIATVLRHTEELIAKEAERHDVGGMTHDAAKAQHTAAVAELLDKRDAIKAAKAMCKTLAASATHRLQRWTQFRSFVKRSTSRSFEACMNDHSKYGKVKFDDVAKTLSIVVQQENLDRTTTSRVVRQVRSAHVSGAAARGASAVANMSGGERSTATLALLLALGTCAESPFRAMDEFDVFMDAQARRVAIAQLIAHARTQRQRQFIFITPQDLSGVRTAPDLRIFKMPDPRAAQQQQQRTLDETLAG
ncbi:RecF/RecN/SMC [Tribonema minus]|uniref:RecF/RecN/SMC n=1 Tax=Tribonema minus TaxID=303371 RepID=A0A836CNS7_9STRA|nr:RecF/RecN/SMC [Tribonema minus]